MLLVCTRPTFDQELLPTVKAAAAATRVCTSVTFSVLAGVNCFAPIAAWQFTSQQLVCSLVTLLVSPVPAGQQPSVVELVGRKAPALHQAAFIA